MERVLAGYHPIVSFSYFVVVIGTSMLYMNPVFQVISLIGALSYLIILDRYKTLKLIKFIFVMVLVIAIINMIFVNRGSTVLFYLRSNPVTLESLFYGFVSGLMLGSVMVWFSCYNEIMTSDKFLYIFGKITPTIALIVSMTLRLIPKLIEQTKIIANSQKTLGIDYNEGNISLKIKSCMRILSILVTWALEDAVQTADSMKARGYGIKKRTSFQIFEFINRDMVMLVYILISGMFLLAGYINGYGQLIFYPTIQKIDTDILSNMLYITFFIISILPSIQELRERYKWRYLE